MPVYEYQCKKCRHKFELKQSFDDDPIVTCPKCGGKAKRVFSSVPIIFKGSGFYTTDSKPTGGEVPKPKAKPDTSKH